MSKKKLLDQYVLDVMKPRTSYKPDRIDSLVRFTLGDEYRAKWTDLYTWSEFWYSFQTIATALKHLVKAGKVRQKLHKRGYFKWYEYTKVDTDA